MINTKIVKSARKLCLNTIVSPEQVCALIDFISKAKNSYDYQDVEFDAQIVLAAQHTRLKREDLFGAFENFSNAPYIKFCPAEWDSVKNLLPSKLSDGDRFILSCKVGMTQALARAYVYSQPGLMSNPSKWIPAVRQFCAQPETQIAALITELTALKALDPRKDVINTYLAKQLGHGTQVVSVLPETQTVAHLIKDYRDLISSQVIEEVEEAKKEGSHPLASFK